MSRQIVNAQTGAVTFDAADIAPSMSASELLAQWRDRVSLSRLEFLRACIVAGILSHADAVEAAKGEVPTSMNAALSALPQAEQDDARMVWASAVTVRRNSPILALFQTHVNITDAQLDALFGGVS